MYHFVDNVYHYCLGFLKIYELKDKSLSPLAVFRTHDSADNVLTVMSIHQRISLCLKNRRTTKCKQFFGP